MHTIVAHRISIHEVMMINDCPLQNRTCAMHLIGNIRILNSNFSLLRYSLHGKKIAAVSGSGSDAFLHKALFCLKTGKS